MLTSQQLKLSLSAIATGIILTLVLAPAQAATLIGYDVTSVYVGSLVDNPNATIGGITYSNE